MMPPPRRTVDLRAGAAVLAARVAGTLSRALGRGGGTALPGLVAERIAPRLLRHLASQLPGGAVVVTGTNGKTTTSHMLAGILTEAGKQPLRNASGSNLARGITTSIAAHADWAGRLAANPELIGLFETDEAAFAHVVPAVRPRLAVVTNLFRDQLDRYGEVDTVAAIWRRSLAELLESNQRGRNQHGSNLRGPNPKPAAPAGRATNPGMVGDSTEIATTLVLNADDPTVAALAGPLPGDAPDSRAGVGPLPGDAPDRAEGGGPLLGDAPASAAGDGPFPGGALDNGAGGGPLPDDAPDGAVSGGPLPGDALDGGMGGRPPALSPPLFFPAVYYGVEDVTWGKPGPEHASDAKVCPTCGRLLSYPVCFYGHIGHYACDAGHHRPAPAVLARRLERLPGLGGTRLEVETPSGAFSVTLPLPGIHNVYNALAAIAAAYVLGVPATAITAALARFTAAFGRLERVEIDGRTVYMALAKNPVGMNETLRTLFWDECRHHVLMALNDLDADGRDVSWIWDADFEHVAGHVATLGVAGRRAEDLAVRLKYAGALHDVALRVEPNLTKAFDWVLAQTPSGQAVYVVLTYTAMLELRGVLSRRGNVTAYWKE